jgi:hypothetical protein
MGIDRDTGAQHTSTPAYFGYAAASYDLHHNIISRHKAKLLGWTEDMINSLSNLRPECKQCSHRTGAIEGQKAMRVKRRRAQQTKIVAALDNSRCTARGPPAHFPLP